MDKRVFYTKSKVELMGVKNLLESQGIKCYEVDKVDSSYAGVFGNYELMVDESDEEKAKEIIDQFESK
ncbi:DUF2007 domain-containing protein [Psychroflexus sp. CAK57W]|uniref:putative signal transducing protein n=1 Tax=Psychroflexus curvus TaxID=2873595 RepID=UPI001CCAFC96|nr:DUF2007 domain-containing protein [Psychroflexus curvus]MBZ9628963.1 DUF2007 domain-containing protein [Psychroflexus curvus]MBZ9787349.1 DUF2007 domain-containing protein [Psychroflexus curvus]